MYVKPLVLLIMDGFGLGEDKNNAIKAARTPNLDEIFKDNPTTALSASGLSVGLPKEQMGNSEVGHTNIGAGRVVYQELTRIDKSIRDGDFYKNETLKKAMDHAITNDSALHLMGLLSNGGVHSHIEHLYALLKLAAEKNVQKVYVHAFLDGRDTLPTSGKNFLAQCQEVIKEVGIGSIATICGRYFAMDRDNRWERVKKAYDLLTCGNGENFADFSSALEHYYEKGVTDEFMQPIVVGKSGTVKNGDSVIFFNFRPDRARELTRALTDKSFDKFNTMPNLNIHFVCFTQYDKNFENVDVAFLPQPIKDTFAEVISKNGLSQLRIAETEKYAHVTFFFNAGVEKPYPLEDRILVHSPKVATYDLKPEMSAYEVTEKAIDCIKKNIYNVIILNFANCDMVGHTGNFKTTVEAVEVVDECVGKIIREVKKTGGASIITADHGNADKMLDDNGNIFTSHTTNKVPFCIVGYDCKLRDDGSLSNIAPTMLEILKIGRPESMSADSLILK